jgi:hypothetical protein
VHLRPLAIVSVLAGGDYLLWNWSLQGNHDVLALVAGLTLPPLALALIWLLALNGARLLARAARSSQEEQKEPGREQGHMRTPQLQPQSLTQHEQHQGGEQASTQASSSYSKLAA